MTVLLLSLAYLIGSTPTSHWVARSVYGIDLRERGSGNLGATNTYRVLGWKAALPVLAVDVGKGWFPVYLFPQLDGASAVWALAYGGAALAGHAFSFWIRFRGGKGVATGAGVLLALAPWTLLVAFATWLLLLVLTRIVSVASLGAALVLPAALLAGPDEANTAAIGFAAALTLFVVWTHRENIRRLAKGEERRIGERGPGMAR